MGTFYNSRALEWFECARTDLLRAAGIPYADMERKGYLLPLVEAHVNYLGRARYDDPLTLTTCAAPAGKASLRFDVSIVNASDNALIVTGYTVHAVTDPAGKPTRLPDWVLNALTPPDSTCNFCKGQNVSVPAATDSNDKSPMINHHVTNIVTAGLGGQGVIKASDILADVAFRAGLDVKKAEIHGMSQRGGSVTSDVRFGDRVLSPMVPSAQAHFLLIFTPDQVDNNIHYLRPGGVLLTPSFIDESKLSSKRSLNIALLGALSHHLPFPESLWLDAIKANLPEITLDSNLQAFQLGRTVAASTTQH